jgi:hypothetical protein
VGTYYCNFTDGSDTTGDGSSGSPWKTLQKAYDSIVGGGGNTNAIYLQADETLTTALNQTTYRSGGTKRLSVHGDGERRTLTAPGAYFGTIATTYTTFELLGFSGDGSASIFGQHCHWSDCVFNSARISGGSNAVVDRSWFKGVTPRFSYMLAVGSGSFVSASYFDMRDEILRTGVLSGAGSAAVVGCVLVGPDSPNGDTAIDSRTPRVIGCTLRSLTRGLAVRTTGGGDFGGGGFVGRTIFSGCGTGALTTGIDRATIANCSFHDCGTNISGEHVAVNNETLASSPFADVVAGDYSPVALGSLRSGAFGSWAAEALANTPNVLPRGAVGFSGGSSANPRILSPYLIGDVG